MNELTSRAQVFREISKDPESALLLAQQNVEKHPENIEAMLILADLYFLGIGPGRESAAPLYKTVLHLDPGNPSALTGLALMPGVSAEESLVLLERVTAIVGNTLTYMNLGYKQWETGRYPEALDTFEHLDELARSEQNRELVSSLKNIVKRIRKRLPPISYSYAVL